MAKLSKTNPVTGEDREGVAVEYEAAVGSEGGDVAEGRSPETSKDARRRPLQRRILVHPRAGIGKIGERDSPGGRAPIALKTCKRAIQDIHRVLNWEKTMPP
jgi:hypothetical protein